MRATQMMLDADFEELGRSQNGDIGPTHLDGPHSGGP
jgi:hypothetical protein